ncbi:hypothetical protein PS6_004521 [Mucor atramentarius]
MVTCSQIIKEGGFKLWLSILKASKLTIDWENISAVILDRLVTSAYYEFQKEAKSVAKESVTRRSISSTAISSVNDTPSSDVLTVKQAKLSNEEERMMKQAISQDNEQ